MNEKNEKNSKSEVKNSNISEEIKTKKNENVTEVKDKQDNSTLVKKKAENSEEQIVIIDKKEIQAEVKENRQDSKLASKNLQKNNSVEAEDKKTAKNSSNKSQSKNSKQKISNNDNPAGNNKGFSEDNEYIEKLVSINRVAKVVKGGRRFSFAALVVVGDGNGMVGHGKGKAKEVPEAIKKATDEAKSRMIRVPLRQARTLHHDITGRYDAGKVTLRSAPSGTGVIAGGPMRSVFEALGIKDIVAKSVGSSNPHNMIRATFDALSSASSPKLISLRRGLKVNEITKRRKGANVIMENPDA